MLRATLAAPIFAVMLGVANTAHAFELQAISVTKDGAVYKVQYLARVDVPIATAKRYLLDVDHFGRLSDRVRESRVLAQLPGGRQRIRLVFENCVLFLCKTTHRTATLEVIDNLAVVRTEPVDSDFHYGHERWEAREDAGGTVIEYHGGFIPKFWIPPIIDTWLIKNYAEGEIAKTGERLEALARTTPAVP